MGGECEEILIWPLGGLAFVDTPREWKPHTVTALGGPFTNVLQCFVAAGVLVGAGFAPTLSPFDNPYVSPMKGLRDGRTYTSEYGLKLYDAATGTPHPDYEKEHFGGPPEAMHAAAEKAAEKGYERAVAPPWAVWVNRLFWLNMVLTLINAIPAFPLDGGQLLQGLVWWRTDYRQGTLVACVSGFACATVMFVASLAVDSTLLISLCFFIAVYCFITWRRLTESGGEFGFDTEAGYRGLDEDDGPRKRPQKRPGFLKRWQQARTAKRLQEEHEQRAKDDERMDGLLEKINRKEPLTDEERRFMQRVSERYRKPQ